MSATASTTETATETEIDNSTTGTWTKPGPGTWELDTGHFSADCARICHDLIEVACTEGMADGFKLLGAPLKTLEARFVNGCFYMRRVPLIAGDKDLPAPPNPVLWLATRLHPAFRRAERTAKAALDGRIWLDELQRWQNEWKPQLIATSRRLSSVDPSVLSDVELADHIDETVAHVTAGLTLHFRLHVSDLGPIGLLLLRGAELGLDQTELMEALSGHSPATNAPGMALAEIRRRIASEPTTPTTLDEARNLSSDISALLDSFLNEFGWRLTTGYDLRDLTLSEMPEAILTAITAPVTDGNSGDLNDRAKASGDAAFARLLAQIDDADHHELCQLVDDARALYGLRDENGPITFQWPAGLLRRAMLEASKRLDGAHRLPVTEAGKAGLVNDAVFDLHGPEISALLRGTGGPSVDEISTRYAQRMRWATFDPPAVLGPEEVTPPLWVMPPTLGRELALILMVMDLIETEGDVTTLSGVGIGNEPVVGTACVVTDAEDALNRLEPGDILVAPFTVPTFNSVLSVAGGVVVDSGGLLCHAAVIAREYGIPAVVGVGAATTTIPNGATITVDPTTGTVTVL